jgi:hypothetical protein
MTSRGEGYQGFCDNSTKASVLKSVTMGGGVVKNYQKLRDIIYGRSHTRHKNSNDYTVTITILTKLGLNNC